MRNDLDDLAQHVSRLEGSISLFVRLFIAFSISILVGIMLKMILTSQLVIPWDE